MNEDCSKTLDESDPGVEAGAESPFVFASAFSANINFVASGSVFTASSGFARLQSSFPPPFGFSLRTKGAAAVEGFSSTLGFEAAAGACAAVPRDVTGGGFSREDEAFAPGSVLLLVEALLFFDDVLICHMHVSHESAILESDLITFTSGLTTCPSPFSVPGGIWLSARRTETVGSQMCAAS